MNTIKVNLGKNSYDVHIGSGVLDGISEYMKTNYSQSKVLIVTDDNVYDLYGKSTATALSDNGINCQIISLPPGEGTKSLASANSMYEKLIQYKLSRTDILMAIGGGVIGDLTGFVAATYLRGIPFIQVPTTVLAQIDSSIGGKTAVNLPTGKNLVGAFYHPKAVFIDTNTLTTLRDEDFASGIAEIIKTGCILDAKLFDKLSKNQGRANIMPIIEDIITTCVDIKRVVVEEDELDRGERMKLNFGHTLGHALEKSKSAPPLSHGQAVAIGMVDFARRSEDMGIAKPGTANSIKTLNKGFGLPTELPNSVDYDEVKQIISRDKKVLNNKLNIILLEEIGKAIIKPVDLREFL